MALKIAIFSINDNVDCTKTSVQIANYFVGENQYKIAVVESGSENKYKDFYITREDGIYELNNIHYIPSGTSYSESNYDIIIKDFGKVNALFSFAEAFDKIYLCEKSDPSGIFEMSDFLTEQNIACDVMLFDASKEDLNAYKSYGYACINMIETDKNICSYEASMQLGLLLRKNGITPPDYNKNVEFSSIVLASEIITEDDKPKKKGIFGKKSKKNKEIKVDESVNKYDDKKTESFNFNEEQNDENFEEDSIKTEESEEIISEPVHKTIKATPFESPNYVSVPEPKRIEITKEEESKQIEVEKELEELQKLEREDREKRKAAEIQYKEELQKKEQELTELKTIHEQEKQKELKEKDRFFKEELQKKQEEINALIASQEKQKEIESQEDEKHKQEIAELKYKNTHDSLTGVKNRTAFDEDIHQIKEFTLIAFDVNDLKVANDTYGHDKGDLLLKTISGELSNIFGAEHVYRMGGDEFNVILHGAIPKKEALDSKLTKLDKILEKKTKSSADITYQVAYGYAYSSEGTVGEVIKAADQRMYDQKREKKQGRTTSVTTEIQSPRNTPIETNIPAKKPKLQVELPKKFSILDKIQSFTVKDSLGISGHISVFVTSLRHSVGTSYISGSLASAMTDLYNRDVWIDHKSGDIIPDNIMVKEIITDEDRFNAFKNGIVIFDRGLYKDLSNEDRNEMLRADLNIMVSTADEVDLRNLAAFIKKEKDNADKWLFVFNHVQPSQKALIDTVMRNYNHLIIPPHDYSEVPMNIRKDWKDAINYCITTL